MKRYLFIFLLGIIFFIPNQSKADTFGYTTLGAGELTNIVTHRGIMTGTYVASTGDIVTKYSYGGRCFSVGSGTIDIVAYTVVSSKPNTKTGTVQTLTLNSTIVQWWNTGTVTNNLTGGNTYTVAVGNNNGGCGSGVSIERDSGTPNTSKGAASGVLPTTWTESGTEAFLYSIYATYTPAGGAITNPAGTLKVLNGKLNAFSNLWIR